MNLASLSCWVIFGKFSFQTVSLKRYFLIKMYLFQVRLCNGGLSLLAASQTFICELQ